MKDKRIAEINEILMYADEAIDYVENRIMPQPRVVTWDKYETMSIKAEAFDKINAIMSGVKEKNWWEK